jgi:hypothetical protein
MKPHKKAQDSPQNQLKSITTRSTSENVPNPQKPKEDKEKPESEISKIKASTRI